MKKMKIFTCIGTTTAVALPMAVISCGSNDNKEWEYADGSFSGVNWKMNVIPWKGKDVQFGIEYVDAELVKWIDGDTPIVKFDEDKFGFTKSDNPHIRVAWIDTPELHVKNEDTGKIDQLTTGIEFKYAEAARKFADSEIPVGSKIRIATNGAKSYDRIVGSIFYGDNFEKSFEVNILKEGLAYPFKSDAATNMEDKKDISHYLALPIADAYNIALSEKRGLFSKEAMGATEIHGSTDTSSFDWECRKLPGSNVYKTAEKRGYKL